LSAGGYREFLVYGYEEPELALRLWLAGIAIEYFPITIIHNHFCTPDERRDDNEYDYLYARNGILMSSLNMPLWFGLPHGLARSIRHSIHFRKNFGAKFCGTLSGVWLSFALWQKRTPCRFAQALAWCRHVKEN
jgi:GT2 family glycosyltransferase